MEKYYIEVQENNQDYDDIFKVNCYEKETDNLVGYIDIEVLMNGSDYLSDVLDYDEYNELFDENEELLNLQYIEVTKQYRKKGIGNFMMKKLFNEIIPKYFQNYDYIVLLKSSYNVPEDMKSVFNQNILKKFYESFGFTEIDNDPDYMYKIL